MGKADALNGRWTSNWGEVRLNVAGGAITGTWAQGGIEGSATDDGAVSITWSHRDGTTGKAALKADADFAKLAGTWGFDGADSGEGDWSLSQVERVATASAPSGDATAGDAPTGDAPAGDAPAGDGGEAPAPAPEKPKKGK